MLSRPLGADGTGCANCKHTGNESREQRTREQRCWWHKIGNVLNALPESAQPGAKAALAEIWNAQDKDHAIRTGQVACSSTPPGPPTTERHPPTTSPMTYPRNL